MLDGPDQAAPQGGLWGDQGGLLGLALGFAGGGHATNPGDAPWKSDICLPQIEPRVEVDIIQRDREKCRMQVVARDGIEPPTPAFSGLRSTD